MADLTPLDEKLGEVLDWPRPRRSATETIGGSRAPRGVGRRLERMRGRRPRPSAAPRSSWPRPEGRKTAIREKAHDTKGEGHGDEAEYLGGVKEALDGFEFLSMAEAGELCTGRSSRGGRDRRRVRRAGARDLRVEVQRGARRNRPRGPRSASPPRPPGTRLGLIAPTT